VSVGAWLASAAGCAPTLNEAMLNESAREARESLMVCKGYPKTPGGARSNRFLRERTRKRVCPAVSRRATLAAMDSLDPYAGLTQADILETFPPGPGAGSMAEVARHTGSQ
jgi:hypothetical protein